MFTLTPLLGAHSSAPASASLLTLDASINILIDVGCDTPSALNSVSALIAPHVPTLSLILLTHPTLSHIGAYVHCCKHIPAFAGIPVYATTPVINLGRTLITDLYASAPLLTSTIPSRDSSSPQILLPPPTAADISSYFSLIHPLKFSQPHSPLNSHPALTITAYAAGHTLGGTLWHLQHALESIVYATSWSQSRENLFPGAQWLSPSTSSAGGAEITPPLHRPTTLVTSSHTPADSLPRKSRDATLVSLLRSTVALGGRVLLPTSSPSQALELAFLLDRVWRDNVTGPHAATYTSTPIYLASRTAKTSIRYLQAMLEWVDEGVRGEAELVMTREKGQGRGPLDWGFVECVESSRRLDKRLKARQGPCVIIASDASMQWGFSLPALKALSDDPKNLLVITERSEDGNTLPGQLTAAWQSSPAHVSSSQISSAKIVEVADLVLALQEPSAEPLAPEETNVYEAYIVQQQQQQLSLADTSLAATTNLETADAASEASSSDSEEDEDAEYQGRALNISAQVTQQSAKRKADADAEVAGVNVLLRKTGTYDWDVRGKRGREKVFPFAGARKREDDYGEVITAGAFLRAEEKEMREEQKMPLSGKGAKRALQSNGGGSGTNKRFKASHSNGNGTAGDEVDAAISRATNPTAADDSASSSESEYDPEDESLRKLVFTQQDLHVKCRITHVDFSSLHERRDLQMLVPLIRPRKLILLAGSEEETTGLASEMRRLLGSRNEDGEEEEGGAEVFAPQVGESVDASVDTNAWVLKLGSGLVKRLVWQDVKGKGVVALSGRLLPYEDEEGVEEKGKPHYPVLDLLPSLSSSAAPTGAAGVHVGDLRIADLRLLLREAGHVAEFRGEGTLVIDGCVVVRKTRGGRIEVEGGWYGGGLEKGGRESFGATRQAVYRGLAVVAGV